MTGRAAIPPPQDFARAHSTRANSMEGTRHQLCARCPCVPCTAARPPGICFLVDSPVVKIFVLGAPAASPPREGQTPRAGQICGGAAPAQEVLIFRRRRLRTSALSSVQSLCTANGANGAACSQLGDQPLALPDEQSWQGTGQRNYCAS
jgi:hypothetical protein